jgi:hypothetical protein
LAKYYKTDKIFQKSKTLAKFCINPTPGQQQCSLEMSPWSINGAGAERIFWPGMPQKAMSSNCESYNCLCASDNTAIDSFTVL